MACDTPAVAVDTDVAEGDTPHQSWFAIQGLRSRTFGPASEQPYRRRTSDWIRLVIAVGIMVALASTRDDPTDARTTSSGSSTACPTSSQPFFERSYRFGALWALGLVVVAALVARRWRLARDMAIAGVAAWFLARLIGALVVENASLREEPRTSSPASGRVAVVPGRPARGHRRGDRGRRRRTSPGRRAGSASCSSCSWRSARSTSAPGSRTPRSPRSCSGGASPPIVHLVFGSPGGRPTTRAGRRRRSHELGGSTATWSSRADQPRRGTIMLAEDERRAAADPRARARRSRRAAHGQGRGASLLYKDGGPELHLDPPRATSSTRRTRCCSPSGRGVRVPQVVVAGAAGPERGAARRSARSTATRSSTPIPRTSPTRCSTTSGSRCGRLHDAHVSRTAR